MRVAFTGRGPIPSGPGIGRDLPRLTLKGNGERGRMGCICIVIQPRRMKVVTAFENFTAEIIDHHPARLRLSFARRVSVATYVKGGKCPDHKSTADSNPFRPPGLYLRRENSEAFIQVLFTEMIGYLEISGEFQAEFHF